ncbi:MAG: hypothetical protein K6C40_05745 [Thermoguttaceae bacterium]|nr:hypothetical protein [Thermoguttaceae bacterium]
MTSTSIGKSSAGIRVSSLNSSLMEETALGFILVKAVDIKQIFSEKLVALEKVHLGLYILYAGFKIVRLNFAEKRKNFKKNGFSRKKIA